MASQILFHSSKRLAVVTGGNKGIGLEVCKQLAGEGIVVILTARDEKRGIEAQDKLNQDIGHFGNHVIFHQLDVLDPVSAASLADFIKINYGRLDILVNNAGIGGAVLEGSDPSFIDDIAEDVRDTILTGRKAKSVELRNVKLIENLEDAEKCVHTNYYGSKQVSEALIPLLQLSDSPRIVNVTSIFGNLRLLNNEWAKGILGNEEKLTEERVDEVLEEFLKSFKEGSLEREGWPTQTAAYKLSKAALCAYTRILAKRHTNFFVNCICPGSVRTDIAGNHGELSAAEGAKNLVALALQPHGGPSGQFFNQDALFFF